MSLPASIDLIPESHLAHAEHAAADALLNEHDRAEVLALPLGRWAHREFGGKPLGISSLQRAQQFHPPHDASVLQRAESVFSSANVRAELAFGDCKPDLQGGPMRPVIAR